MPRTSAKPAAKKAAAKKTVSRRRINKAETPVEVEVLTAPTTEAGEAMVGKSDQSTEGSFKDLFLNLLDGTQIDPAAQVRPIEFIDLRGVNFFGRFQVITLLQNAGYSFSADIKSPMTDVVELYRFAEALHLNHHNKLAMPVFWEAAKTSAAISTVKSAYAVPTVDFSASLPEVVEINGELFARVK